jgi:hypothetical protein
VGVSRRLRTKFGNARTSDVSIKSWSWPPRGSHHAPDKTDHESARQDCDHSDRLAHYPGGVTEEPPAREDLAAAIGARRELGKEYEDAVVDSFVARLDQRIAERVDERVAERLGSSASAMSAPASTPAKAAGHSFILGMASLFAGIPITALSSEAAGSEGLFVSWAGIAGVNFAHALSRRRSS